MAEHETVLLTEAVTHLITQKDQIYVDGTFGHGGHSALILAHLAPQGRLLALDKDREAVARATIINDPRLSCVHSSFSQLHDVLALKKITAVQGVLLDLGLNRGQLDDAQRGFSFQQSGPLDMRIDSHCGLSLAQWLDTASEQDMVSVLRDYGEERFALSIARALVPLQGKNLFEKMTTTELAAIIAQRVKTREAGKNPATRSFQAFRMHINQELQVLKQGLAAALQALAVGGRLVVISFHSLEDRLVKQFMRFHAGIAPLTAAERYLPIQEEKPARLKLLGRYFPSHNEIERNRRARSAVMRVAEKIS